MGQHKFKYGEYFYFEMESGKLEQVRVLSVEPDILMVRSWKNDTFNIVLSEDANKIYLTNPVRSHIERYKR